MALHPPAFRRACFPGGSGQEGAPIAAAERHRCWTTARTSVRVGLYLYTCDLGMYLAVSGRLAGGSGERDLRGCFYHLPWQLLGWRLGWKDCCCGWLLLDLLAISRMLCSVAVLGVMLPTMPELLPTVPDLKKKETGIERSGPTPSAFRRAGWHGGSGTGVCFLRLSSPTSSLARRRHTGVETRLAVRSPCIQSAKWCAPACRKPCSSAAQH